MKYIIIALQTYKDQYTSIKLLCFIRRNCQLLAELQGPSGKLQMAAGRRKFVGGNWKMNGSMELVDSIPTLLSSVNLENSTRPLYLRSNLYFSRCNPCPTCPLRHGHPIETQIHWFKSSSCPPEHLRAALRSLYWRAQHHNDE